MAGKKKTKRRAAADGAGKAPAPGADLSRELDSLRVAIDRADRRLIDLLNRRAKYVVRVGKIKRTHGIPIYVPHRETEVLSRVQGMNKGPLEPRTIEGVYRELMSGSFRLELPLRIGYLGPAGSFSHVAAVKHFGTSVDFENLRAIDGVFTEVARGHVDYGLVPIENSIGGGIAETLEAFQEFHSDVSIYAEVQLEVHHALLANCPPSKVKRIYSKPEVFQQCRTWLATQYPQAELVAEASSAAAVKRVVEEGEAQSSKLKAQSSMGKRRNGNGAGVAAIGSVLAGEIYDVNVLFENIEDKSSNITRFFVIRGRKDKGPPLAAQSAGGKPSGRLADGRSGDKTSIMFTTADEPGALVSVLGVFQRAGINLTHIDKRPSGRSNWTYTFFIDTEGHMQDAGPPYLAAAVQQAAGLCKELHVLGSYPRSRRIL